jgi:hypothetical protein
VRNSENELWIVGVPLWSIPAPRLRSLVIKVVILDDLFPECGYAFWEDSIHAYRHDYFIQMAPSPRRAHFAVFVSACEHGRSGPETRGMHVVTSGRNGIVSTVTTSLNKTTARLRSGPDGRKVTGAFVAVWRGFKWIEAIQMIRQGRLRWVAKEEAMAQALFIGLLVGIIG